MRHEARTVCEPVDGACSISFNVGQSQQAKRLHAALCTIRLSDDVAAGKTVLALVPARKRGGSGEDERGVQDMILVQPVRRVSFVGRLVRKGAA